ncbi:unnamed protein product [Cylindrotheca closterium]|uniref:Uncharacterized protein n=1 Tax=Cylindrotheca closterium TaxID=2856 RepID=A0AAD2PWI4_9STRA|nr:unnamed protein product [Cylindrotheca closterium]
MLVELSPWKSVRTSLSAPKINRRRKRDEAIIDLPIVFSSVVTGSKRGSQKMKHSTFEFTDMVPFVTVTSEHEISVIGQANDQSYHESGSLRYSTRPLKKYAFMTVSEGKSTKINLVRIPAIFDTRSDRVFAFQEGNTCLCAWKSSESGPEDKSCLKVQLDSPALSMTMLSLHRGIVYGSCDDGSIYVGRVVSSSDGGEKIIVEYVPSDIRRGLSHVGTIAKLSHSQQASGEKRKSAGSGSESFVTFFQLFSKDDSFSLISHHVSLEKISHDGRFVMSETASERKATIKLPKTQSLGSIELLISASGSTPKAAIYYTATSGSSKNKSTDQCCASISLDDGSISQLPVLLPATTKGCALVSANLLAAATVDSVIVYDLETGSVLQNIEVGSVVTDAEENWKLATNSKSSTLAILYAKQDTIEAAFSVLSVGDDKRIPSRGLKLASRLASALAMPDDGPFTVAVKPPLVVRDLLDLDQNDTNASTAGSHIQKALKALDLATTKMLEEGGETSIFLDTYEGCVSRLMKDLKLPLPDGVPATPSRAGKKQKSKNGKHSSDVAIAVTPSSLPQGFIDGSLRIVLYFLQSCKKLRKSSGGHQFALACADAGLIIDRLVETGKVSARLHFEDASATSGNHLMESVLSSIEVFDENVKRSYSSITLILSILRKCNDLSEGILVAMLNFMLRNSVADDIAEALNETKVIAARHPCKSLCQDYVSAREKYLKLRLKSDDTKMPQDLQLLTSKLLTKGTRLVLERIISYSDCNQGILRVALSEGLGNHHEAIIVAKMLTEILSDAPKDSSSGKSAKRSKMKTTCQWITALCDGFQDELALAKAPSGKSYLEFLLESVSAATKHSEAIISLREDVDRNILHQLDLTDKDPKVVKPGAMRRGVGDENLPGYSIESMVI